MRVINEIRGFVSGRGFRRADHNHQILPRQGRTVEFDRSSYLKARSSVFVAPTTGPERSRRVRRLSRASPSHQQTISANSHYLSALTPASPAITFVLWA